MRSTQFMLNDFERQKEHVLCCQSKKISTVFSLIKNTLRSLLGIKEWFCCHDYHFLSKFIFEFSA